ncbi:MAG: Protease [Bacteroidota bacterium]|jgi:protease-4
MKQFFKFTIASFLGIFLFSIVSFFLTLGIIVAISSDDGEVDVPKNSILKLNLNGNFVENASLERNPFDGLNIGLLEGNSQLGLIQLIQTIDKAAKDDRIQGIYMEAASPIASYAQLFELREALERFSDSGKFIYSYAEVYTEKGYFLSSVSDEVFANPSGIIDFNGIMVRYSYYKKLFDKLGIEPVIYKVGKYKSAVESFSRSNMSEENRQQSREMIYSINHQVMKKISESRGISEVRLNEIADSLLAFQPVEAEKLNMVSIAYKSEVDSLLKEEMGIDQEDDLEFISFRKYAKVNLKDESYEGSDRIGVLVADGEILGAKSMDGYIGFQDFNKELKELVDNKRIKAIVIRINSPGGSSLATDIMWKAIKDAKKKKPIIVSMSGYAASGGYYMAVGADKIVASPTTITGSIGIFSQWIDISKFMEDKLGITYDQVMTNQNSDFLQNLSKLSDYQSKVMLKNIQAGYDDFISKVADGRKMTKEEILELASGRVWTGEMAKKVGLVDELGGLDKAIEIAALDAKLEKNQYKVLIYPKAKSAVEELLDSSQEDVSSKLIQGLGSEFYPYSKALLEIKKIQKRNGLMCVLPYGIEIE